MKSLNRILSLGLTAMLFGLASCDKTKPYDVDVAPPEAHFTGAKYQAYSAADDPAPVFNLVVGTTDVAKTDRDVTYKVTPISNAVAGTDYTIATGNTTGTVTIKAGEAVANIPVQAIRTSYLNGERDTLMFTLAEPSLKISGFLDTVYVTIRGACFEGDVTLTELLGDYPNTNETFGANPYGPYLTSITSVTQTSPTTGSVTVENIWDNGWAPIVFDLDWTDPNNRIVSLLQQDNIADGGTIDPSFAGQGTVTVTNPTNAAIRGTFSICNQKLELKMRVCILPLGCFTALYTVIMQR